MLLDNQMVLHYELCFTIRACGATQPAAIPSVQPLCQKLKLQQEQQY